MSTPSTGDLEVRLTVDDARTIQAAGVAFARTLSGAHSADFALALAEQEHLVEHAIVDAGYGAEQARLTAQHFGTAARDEWQLEVASGGYLRGTA